MTDQELFHAAAKNAAYIMQLEKEIDGLKAELDRRKLPKPLSIMDLKDIREAAQRVMDQLENTHARMTPHGLVWDYEASRKEWVLAKKRVKEINYRIAAMKL